MSFLSSSNSSTDSNNSTDSLHSTSLPLLRSSHSQIHPPSKHSPNQKILLRLVTRPHPLRKNQPIPPQHILQQRPRTIQLNLLRYTHPLLYNTRYISIKRCNKSTTFHRWTFFLVNVGNGYINRFTGIVPHKVETVEFTKLHWVVLDIAWSDTMNSSLCITLLLENRQVVHPTTEIVIGEQIHFTLNVSRGSLDHDPCGGRCVVR
mmetsp:Transcript_2476/g.2989  ORF Transcript_2476/g.2989 Transcript_2476/m.2989 type:complete len:205 (+) Transcript_2476:126-740(+)